MSYCIGNLPLSYKTPIVVINIKELNISYLIYKNNKGKYGYKTILPRTSGQSCKNEISTVKQGYQPLPYVPDIEDYIKYDTELINFLMEIFPCTDEQFWISLSNPSSDVNGIKDYSKLLPPNRCPLGNGVLYCRDKDSSVCPFLPAKKVKKLNIVYVILMSIVLLILFILMMLVLFSSEGKKIMSN